MAADSVGCDLKGGDAGFTLDALGIMPQHSSTESEALSSLWKKRPNLRRCDASAKHVTSRFAFRPPTLLRVMTQPARSWPRTAYLLYLWEVCEG